MESVTDAHSSMIESIQAQLETLQAEYENTIDGIAKSFEESVMSIGDSGEQIFTSFAQFQEAYSYYQEQQEQYLSTAQEMLGISKLNRSIEQSMEDAVTKTGKARLEMLQKEIKARSEAGKLSQYDVDMMNLQYELILKKNALEEAQNAKDTVRLTRDEHGNMAYQYTANEDNVAKAQQEYEDVLAQINDLATNRQSEILSQFADAESQYAAQLAEIAKDSSLSYEERQARMEQLAAQYRDRLLYLQEQYNQATSDLGANQATIGGLFGTSVEDMNSFMDAANDMFSDESIAAHLQAAQTMATNMVTAMGDYQEALDDLNEQVNALIPDEEDLTAWSTFITTVGGNIDDVNDSLSQELEDLRKINEEWKKVEATINAILPTYEALAAAVNDMVRDAAELDESTAINVNADTALLNTAITEQTTLHETHYAYVERVLEMIANDENTQRALVGTREGVADEAITEVTKPHPNALTTEDDLLISIGENVQYIAAILGNKYNSPEEMMIFEEALQEELIAMQANYAEAIKKLSEDDSLTAEQRIAQFEEMAAHYEECIAALQGEYIAASQSEAGVLIEALTPMSYIPEIQTVANQWLSQINEHVNGMLYNLGELSSMIRPLTEQGDKTLEQHIIIEDANFPGVIDFQALVAAIAELGLDAAQGADRRGGGGGRR